MHGGLILERRQILLPFGELLRQGFHVLILCFNLLLKLRGLNLLQGTFFLVGGKLLALCCLHICALFLKLALQQTQLRLLLPHDFLVFCVIFLQASDHLFLLRQFLQQFIGLQHSVLFALLPQLLVRRIQSLALLVCRRQLRTQLLDLFLQPLDLIELRSELLAISQRAVNLQPVLLAFTSSYAEFVLQLFIHSDLLVQLLFLRLEVLQGLGDLKLILFRVKKVFLDLLLQNLDLF